MQFNEMRNNFDKMGAFLNFISVREAKEVGIIPDFAAEYFPERCQCGSEMILDKFSRARLQCCNPFCSVKQAYMLSEMFRRFGIKGMYIICGYCERCCFPNLFLSLFNICIKKSY